MGQILLTPEEITQEWNKIHYEVGSRLGYIAKAQLKKVVEWGNEPCPHQYLANVKQRCRACWDDLKKEVYGL